MFILLFVLFSFDPGTHTAVTQPHPPDCVH